MGSKKQYADRDHQAQGVHYITHVGAMTAEGLHSKSSIAAELAHRDIEISRLRAESNNPPVVGQPWPEQGGVFIGTRLIDGLPHHIVIADSIEHDILDVKFADVEKVIPRGINGHTDWRAPSQEDLMLAYINARAYFVHEGFVSLYWSRTVRHNCAWAVDFENGNTINYYRNIEFRVRPFRTFPANTI